LGFEPIGATLITEKEFAANFASFWTDLLPLLTPACVAIFNQSHTVTLGDGKPVEKRIGIDTDGLPLDLIAEAGSELASAALAVQSDVSSYVNAPGAMDAAWARAVDSISLHRVVGDSYKHGPSDKALLFIAGLATNYDDFHRLVSERGSVLYSPRISGCGFLGECAGDVAAGDTIYEIKTVGRGFSANDLRQVICYLALDHLSGAPRWTRGGLFNPRRGKLATFEASSFLAYVSGGATATDVFRSVEEFLSSARDFSAERSF
jgi:hypothetical protein